LAWIQYTIQYWIILELRLIWIVLMRWVNNVKNVLSLMFYLWIKNNVKGAKF